ncbi:hypothetical protein ACJ72_06716 [Emergomyces africanus]|uniref:Uncharacterized protein n=1 Tax=Emergomyces africanus TaxID=1955775 RepID=A0A1B7NQ62_9EURO|nr:hypothetical protein ACJ72_06716 [Emergomyces africanus]
MGANDDDRGGGQLIPGQPPSFKTNVNRQKTKRWVNAKSYSYDGDEWGESDEYEDEAPAAPLATVPDQPEVSNPLDIQENRRNKEGEIPAQHTAGENESPKPLPFIRPADIYKRMEEERQKENQKEDVSTTPDTPRGAPNAAQTAVPTANIASKAFVSAPTTTPPAPQDPDQSGGLPVNTTENPSKFSEERKPVSPTTTLAIKPTSKPENGPIGGAFVSHGQESSNPNQDRQEEQPPSTDDTILHHNPSLGFRSVVHQAFDARPETPSTTASSILRSDSASTSVISPIIESHPSATFGDGRGAGPPSTDQTPTIDEEPADFKPGHRRSLSPPNSGTSPARKPVIQHTVHPAKSQLGGVSAASTPEAKPDDAKRGEGGNILPPPTVSDLIPLQQAVSQPPEPENTPAAPEPHPQPSSPANPHVREQPTEPSPSAPPKDEAPHMPPALNVGGDKRSSRVQHDRPAPENGSPSTPENVSPGVHDRLRDEIMQSLSRPVSIVHQEQQPQAAVDSNPTLELGPDKSLPVSPDTASHPNLSTHPPAMETTSAAPIALGDGPDHSSGLAGQQEPATKLKKRFSWEESSVEENNHEPQQLTINPALAVDTTRSSGEEQTPTGPERVSRDLNEQQSLGTPNMNTSQAFDVPDDPTTRSEVSPIQHPTANEPPSVQPCDNPPVQPASVGESSPISPAQAQPQPTPHTLATQDPKLLGFRQIMSMEKSDEKIKTFERTRKQFADIDTGLSTWIKATTSSHPDHAELAQRNGLLPPGTTFTHRPSPSRNKFPKLASLGSLSLQPSHHEGSPTATTTTAGGHTRHGSTANQLSTKINSQQVQAKGKDLLHSAGILGGKAGGAAKGLFAKGRSKFRNSSSTDKVNSPRPGSSSRRRSSSTPSLESPQHDGLDDRQTAAAAATAAGKPLPRLLSLKLDRSPFSNGMTTTWEEHEVTTATSSVSLLSPEPQTAIMWGDTSLGGDNTVTTTSPASALVLASPAPAPKVERNSCPVPLVSPVGSPVEPAGQGDTVSVQNGFDDNVVQDSTPVEGSVKVEEGTISERAKEDAPKDAQGKEKEPEKGDESDADVKADTPVPAEDARLQSPVEVREGVEEEAREEAREELLEGVDEVVMQGINPEIKGEVKEEVKDVKEKVQDEFQHELQQVLPEPQQELQQQGLEEQQRAPQRDPQQEPAQALQQQPQEEPKQDLKQEPHQESQKGLQDQFQPEAQQKVEQKAQQEVLEEAQSPIDSVDERPTSSAALSMVDNRASFMPSDYATYTSPPVEEARAVKVIGRKASVITSELRTFISREINIGKKGKISPPQASEPAPGVEESDQSTPMPSSSGNEHDLSHASRAAACIEPTREVGLSNEQPNDVDVRHSQRREGVISQHVERGTDRRDTVSSSRRESAEPWSTGADKTPQRVSAQHVEHRTDRRDTASSSGRDSTEPRYTGGNKIVQRVSSEPKSPPQSPANKTKALPALPAEDNVVTDQPEGYEPVDKTTSIDENQGAERNPPQSNPVAIDPMDMNNVADETPSLPPPVPDTTAHREAAERQQRGVITEGRPADQVSVPTETPNQRPISPPVVGQPAHFAGSVRDGRSSTQIIREYFSPSGNSSSKPPTLHEESRPGSAMAGLMSKVHFSRQAAERRASATGQSNERSWSSRFQSFKVDSGLSKTRSASALGSEESQRNISVSGSNPINPPSDPPTNQPPPASKMKIHGKFIRGANRLAQNAGEMKKKNMPRVAGLFNRHSRHSEPPTRLPRTPEYSSQQYETQVTALPQPQSYPNRHPNAMTNDYQQEHTGQPQAQPVAPIGGRRSMPLQQSYAQDNAQPSRSSQPVNFPSHTTALAHATPPGSPQSYPNNTQLRAQSPMSFIQFQNGHVPTTTSTQHSARTQSPDPTQHSVLNSTISRAASPPTDGPSHLQKDRNYNHVSSQRTTAPGRHIEPVELPVPIPGDDSSEEIVMSSTAYPGQEWHPEYYMEY